MIENRGGPEYASLNELTVSAIKHVAEEMPV